MPGDVLKGHEALCIVNYKPVTILTHLPPQDTKRLLDSPCQGSGALCGACKDTGRVSLPLAVSQELEQWP